MSFIDYFLWNVQIFVSAHCPSPSKQFNKHAKTVLLTLNISVLIAVDASLEIVLAYLINLYTISLKDDLQMLCILQNQVSPEFCSKRDSY